MEDIAHVIPGQLAAMAYPRSPEVLAEAVRRGFRSLVSLSSRAPSTGAVATLVHLHCALPDFARIAPADLQRVVSFLESAPAPALVHCEGGLGRTGVALACRLVSLGRAASAAIAEVRAARPGSIDHPDLEASVHDYERHPLRGFPITPWNFAPASPRDRVLFGASAPGTLSIGPRREATDEWIAFVQRQGVKRVICLLETATSLLPRYRRAFVDVTHVPVPDHSVPSRDGIAAALAAIARAEAAGEPVVAHCLAGFGRTGILLAGWLRARHGLSAEDAVTEVRAHARYYGAMRNPLEAGDGVTAFLASIPAGAR